MARVPWAAVASLYSRRSRNLVRNAGGILSAGSGRGIFYAVSIPKDNCACQQ